MRASLILLSFLAFAAAAGATGTASVTSSTVVSYDADPSVTMVSTNLSEASYVYNFNILNGSKTNDPLGRPLLDPSGTALATYSGSSSGAFDGTAFTLTSSASLTSATHDVFLDRTYGYRYFFSLENTDSVAHEVDLNVHVIRTGAAAVSRTPYDTTTGLGEAALVTAYGGVIDLDSMTGKGRVDQHDTVDDGNPTSFAVQRDLTQVTDIFGNPAGPITIPSYNTVQFEAYASSGTFLENSNPVPEPAPFAALGVGALALLRRRRRA